MSFVAIVFQLSMEKPEELSMRTTDPWPYSRDLRLAARDENHHCAVRRSIADWPPRIILSAESRELMNAACSVQNLYSRVERDRESVPIKCSLCPGVL